jgi:hypothetical protein
VISRQGEGLLFRYAPEDEDGGEQSHYPSMGVSGLLGGQGGALIPVGNRRMARREEHEAEVNGNDSLSLRERAGARAAEVESNGNGHHNGNGHAKLNGNGHHNGNGHSGSLSLRERAGVRADGDATSFSTLPIIDRLT